MHAIGRVTGSLILALCLAACGARQAEPVPAVRATDPQLNCDHLAAERRVNLERAQDLLKEKSSQEVNNIGMLLITPLFLDLSGTEKREIEALHDRNGELDRLMTARSCPQTGAS